jgi:peptidoglycan/LPS O-acetylase OafA/YrhL
MANEFQLFMFILSPIVLLLDAAIVTSGIIRRFARIEKEDETERTKLFSMVDIMEKIGVALGVLTLLLAGYLAVKGRYVYEWFNPITIVFLCIIGSLLTLRKLEDSPITALIAILAGFVGAAIFSVAFGGTYGGKWIYFGIFLAIDVIVFALARLVFKQLAMFGKILNWLPIAVTIAFACIGWGIFQIIMVIRWGITTLVI